VHADKVLLTKTHVGLVMEYVSGRWWVAVSYGLGWAVQHLGMWLCGPFHVHRTTCRQCRPLHCSCWTDVSYVVTAFCAAVHRRQHGRICDEAP
jgi:hypothetical protein